MLRARLFSGALLILLLEPLAGQNVITTIAGIDPSFGGDGQPALQVPVGYVNGVATDGAGNVYFTDPLEHLVLRVTPDGTLNVVAGNGIAGYSGDGGPATSAAIAASDSPDQYVGSLFKDGLGGIVVDPQRNIYFADSHRVRRVGTDGTITTVAGGGLAVSGDGGPATQASLGIVNGVALDSAGNLYFTENNRVRKVGAGGLLTTYAGIGSNGFSGDGVSATSAQLSQPLGLAFDAQGNLYVADGDILNFPSRIRKVATNGVITTIAGGGTKLPADGVAPLTMNLEGASGLAVDSSGAVYVYSPYRGYLVKFSGATTTLITGTTPTAFVSNVPARNAYLLGQRTYDNSGIAFDPAGNLYVADSRDGRLCKIDKSGFLTTLAGNGGYGFGGDGGPARGALIQGPTAMTQTPDGTIYFLDTLNSRVRAISRSGIIRTVISGANLPGLAILDKLNGIASDPAGNVYIALSHRVVKLTQAGQIQVIVNQANNFGDSGDGGPATQAAFRSLGGLSRDAKGNLYLSDPDSHRIREFTVDGNIHTVAGTGIAGTSPDGSVAAASPVSFPTTLLADSQGGLYFEDSPPPPSIPLGTAVLRYITPDGHLKTIAGNGNPSGAFSGDGGPAVQAGLAMTRTGLALDRAGNLYLSDGFHSRVRVIAPNGIINTLAGNGVNASRGDGTPPLKASLIVPQGLLMDAQGDLLISDVAANRIRAVLAAPPAIAVSPAQMSFSATSRGALTPPQKITIASPVSGLEFTVSKSEGADWLVLGSTGGFTPRLINARVDPTNLAPGAYQATLTITSPLASPVDSNVAVTLEVAPGGNPALAVNKTGLSFTFPSHPSGAQTQVLRVSNVGTGTLEYSAGVETASGGSWLSVKPASGEAKPKSPAFLSVTADPAGLAAGTYTGTIIVSSSTTGENDLVQVTMTVSPLAQAMRLSHAALSFTAVAGGGVVPPASFGISNIGQGSMSFRTSTRTLAGGPKWLSATPESGNSVGGAAAPRVTVRVNPDGLAPGFYFGWVRVDATGTPNTPQVVTIALRVLASDQDPGPVIQPSEIVFTAEQGAPPPGSRNLFVYNVSGTPQTFVSSVTASDPNDQFSFVPDNATLSLEQPTRIVVQPLTSGLAAGVYEAELTLQFSDGYIQRVGIRTIVTAPPAAAALAGSSAEARDATVCTPSQLVPVITSLGQSFGVPAAWPVAVETVVQDDCGNTMDGGSVTASFSNGDPPLSLIAFQDGMWQATWQSGHNTGPVTLTVTANDPVRNLTGTREVTGGLGDSSQAPQLASAVSAASFAANTPLAPGGIISLFGRDLANGTASANGVPLGNTLAGATVVMAGNALPLIYAADGQINAVLSAGINTNTSQQMVVERGNTLSVPILVDVGPAAPAVFGFPAAGDPASQGAVVNAVSYVVAQPGTPVTAGNVIAIFCTGLGAVNPAVPDGTGAPSKPLSRTVATPVVTIGGKDARVAFSGLTPGFVGLYQIDARVPGGIAPGNAVPVVVSIAGQTSQAVTIAVK
jgi:uncharacterized protein (TIGR03437 family)